MGGAFDDLLHRPDVVGHTPRAQETCLAGGPDDFIFRLPSHDFSTSALGSPRPDLSPPPFSENFSKDRSEDLVSNEGLVSQEDADTHLSPQAPNHSLGPGSIVVSQPAAASAV